MDWATDVAEDVGTLVAGLHAALASPPADAPDLAPREATHDELKAWRWDAHRQLSLALDAVGAVDPAAAAELRRDASSIAARLSRFEAVAAAPLVMRIHGDLHLGRLLVADDGYRVVGFEGDPLRSLEDRRRPDSPLRDVASMLRSLDHVARDARRRADAAGRAKRSSARGWTSTPGSSGPGRGSWPPMPMACGDPGAPVTLDLDLLDAFEVAREIRGLVYAATRMPSGLWAPREGMRWLLEHGEPA